MQQRPPTMLSGSQGAGLAKDVESSDERPNPHPLQRPRHIGHLEADGFAEFEVGDDSGDAPVVELAAADFEVGAEFGLGEEFQFVARRGWVRVHA